MYLSGRRENIFMAYCPHCREPFENNRDKFCKRCGEPLQERIDNEKDNTRREESNCPYCDGNGELSPVSNLDRGLHRGSKCPVCGGQGKNIFELRGKEQLFQCKRCGGSGKQGSGSILQRATHPFDRCDACGGKGRVVK